MSKRLMPQQKTDTKSSFYVRRKKNEKEVNYGMHNSFDT